MMNDKIFGVETKSIQPTILVIVALLAYAGPIAAGTIYFQNLYFGINELRKDVNKLAASIDPVASARLQDEVDRLRKMQNTILIGGTSPQVSVRKDLDRMQNDIQSLNARCGTINDRLIDMRRDVDRLIDRHPEIHERSKKSGGVLDTLRRMGVLEHSQIPHL